MKDNVIRYCIPLLISLIFVFLIHIQLYYLIIILLLVSNVLNVLWGRFSNREVKHVLRIFYSSPAVIFIKRFSAVFFTFLLGYELYALNTMPMFQESYHFVFFIFCSGILTGCFVVTLAHDLLHGNHAIDRYLSSLLLIIAGIPHLAVDHVFGHHRNIGLAHDASTAKLNQHFYHYFYQVSRYRIVQSFYKQFDLPKYARRKIFRISMNMTVAWMVVAIIIFVVTSYSWMSIIFFLGQGFIAYLLYELINYIQHYGLKRKDIHAPITQQLSWNCYYKYTNYFLFLLPLHSLHHLPLSERKIRESELCAAPTMPYLYFVMVLMALFPPIFFRKMNPLVRQYVSYVD